MSPRAFRRERERRAAAAQRRERLGLRRAGLAAGAAIGAFTLAPSAAQAANLEVNTLTDAAADGCTTAPGGCTLRDAITDASGNSQSDLITFQSSLTGTIRLTAGQLSTGTTDSNPITIQGPGASVITVSGDADNNGHDAGDYRILAVPETAGGTSVSISGLTLSGGFPASGSGGAIYLDEGSELSLDDATLTDNATNGGASGGAIGSDGSKYSRMTITDSTISGNDGGSGGAIQITGPLTIDRSTISGNDATGSGGAITFGQKYGPLLINNSTISGNSAVFGGGVAMSPAIGGSGYTPQDSKITNTTVSGNTTTMSGGGIVFFGLADADGSFTIDHSTISGNRTTNTTSYGGGIDAVSGAVDGRFTVVDSTVSGNSSGAGGGLSIRAQVGPSGSISADNSTFASNTALYEGGGMWAFSYGGMSPPVQVNSTIVGNNTAGSSPDDLGRANSATSGGFQLSLSLVEAPTDAVATQTNSITGADPQLGGLANNGGLTQTHKPAVSSPAIDKGAAFGQTSDQRDLARTLEIPTIPNAPGGDGTDIGAVELQADELPSNAFTAKVKGKKLIVTVFSAGRVAVADARARLSASAAKKKKPKKRKLFLKPASKSGGPPKITVILRLAKPAKSKLRRTGKVSTRGRITFTPEFGIPNSKTQKLKITGKKKKRR